VESSKVGIQNPNDPGSTLRSNFKKINRIYLTGGGVHNRLLCQSIANATGLPVVSTFAEGTAMGNLIGQLIAIGRLQNLAEGRALLKKQVEPIEYRPVETEEWNHHFEKFKSLINKE